ncbi:MAG: FtsQ-type POTRA domain-containing protein [Blastocatellia bacterium]|nr:FtsQ-type POTRA domain-containing protein [Blastocatellia bacterium]MCS7157037.1 FtsQ-type POTRA domain-containing protein [Blastocatellia bacterium]MCX7752238.1 FtsQ-type POTRA domain-containing protein [Blastocatellia bacterium]MDW8167729.1 FtsQ-type POTRA domain-containing protein [Acidobacteriota bacterium]MDW8256329.1 FtsQ-type POTRA domain-containing protein [Acidobacteriota bacterium]
MLTHVNQAVAPRPRRARDRRARSARMVETVVRESNRRAERLRLRNALRIALRIFVPILGFGALILAARALGPTAAFEPRTLRITGNVRVPIQEIEAIVRRATSRGLLRTDLHTLREDLRQHPLIKDAEIIRVLPDELRVRIIERTPVALVARHRGTPVCVDEEGMVIGDFHLLGLQTLPLLVGWNEEESELAAAENRQRVALYRQLQQELSAPEPSYWDRVDQVNLRDLKNVTVNLTESPMTWIHLGDRDFRRRFELSLQILSAVKKQDAAELRRLGVAPTAELLQEDVTISYIDVSQPSRVVVRLPEPARAREAATAPVHRPSRAKLQPTRAR